MALATTDDVATTTAALPAAQRLRVAVPPAQHDVTDVEAGTHMSSTRAPRRGQRVLDLVIAMPAALLTLPLLLLACALSFASFRANPLFAHTRVGRDGARFRFVKVRSLPPSAPAAADKYTIRAVGTTRIGAFLRRSKLDEIPQIWLVLAGQMSLVGPRPEMPKLTTHFHPAFATARTAVRPGVTGLWQVSDAADGLIYESPEYDLFYLTHHTLRLDVWILWRTLRYLLPGRQPLKLDDVPAWCCAR